MQYATFILNEHVFGIPIYLVQEFSRAEQVYPIVGHDRRIAGFMNLRGRIAVVIDLKKCLGLKEYEDATWAKRPKKMIFLETQESLSEEAEKFGLQSYEEPLVLLVDQISDVITVESHDFYPPPAHVKEEFVEGVVKVNKILLTILSVNNLTADLETFTATA